MSYRTMQWVTAGKRTALIWLIALFVPLVVNAAWTGVGDVSQVFSHDGFHYVQTSIVDNSCGTAGKFYSPTSDSDARDMLAIALAALTADKEVRVNGDFVTPTCSNGGALITHMMVQK